MSKIITDSIKPNTGKVVRISGNVNLLGLLNGSPVSVLTGSTVFTGNTSGSCLSQMYIDTIFGCDTELINSPNLVIQNNAVINGNVTADAFYGDGSNITNLPHVIFTGNTSGECVQDLWVKNLNGCPDIAYINDRTIRVGSNIIVPGTVSAATYYGDSSSMTKSINDIIPVGSGVTSVGVFLQYGINLISTADTGNFCVRLPQTPVDGREVVIINNSGFDIFVYPSMNGGSINGTVNGVSVVPSDGKAYIFTCYENPAPGSWSGNYIQSSGVYDSGVVSIDTSAGTGYVSAYDDNFKHNALGFYSYNAYQSRTQPNILYTPNPTVTCTYSSSGNCYTVFFKPVTPWSFINKITVYTNFTSSSGDIFGLVQGYEKCYYNTGTLNPLQSGYMGSGNIGDPAYGYANQQLAGSPIATPYSPNPGDPGTYYGEINYSLSGRPDMIGDILLSSGTFDLGWQGLVNADYYSSKMIAFIFDTNHFSADVKFRFLIDYTI
jgi:hypothetical protein